MQTATVKQARMELKTTFDAKELLNMYFYDIHGHHTPHFHAEYAEFTAVIAIASGEVLEGELPRNKMKLE